MSDQLAVLRGDCVEEMARMPAESIDSVVCDPPYGLSREPDIAEVLGHWLAGDDYQHRGGGFMGKTWDSFVPGPVTWRAVYRVLKPGGYLLAFGGTRTADLLSIAIRLAGFELRDTILWLYASGFPKSLNVARAIDAKLGVAPEVVGQGENWGRSRLEDGKTTLGDYDGEWDITAPVSDEARARAGFGTALKPAQEPVVMARRPLAGTVAENVLEHGTGAINVDAGRIATGGGSPSEARRESARRSGVAPVAKSESAARNGIFENRAAPEVYMAERAGEALGRWPANLVLSHAEGCELVGVRRVASDGHYPAARPAGGELLPGHGGQDDLDERHTRGEAVDEWECVPGCPVRALDDQAGERVSGSGTLRRNSDKFRTSYGAFAGSGEEPDALYGDRGGASRFYFCAKPSRGERNAGLDDFAPHDGAAIRPRQRECQQCGSRSKAHGKPWPTCGHVDWIWVDDQTVPGDPEDRYKGELRNPHPTVKPVDLMRYFVRLVTPPGGLVLDPFAGSGTTGIAAHLEGMRFVGVEQDESFAEIAEARLRFWAQFPAATDLATVLGGEAVRRRRAEAGQLDLLGSAGG